jgi:hypothetical protein
MVTEKQYWWDYNHNVVNTLNMYSYLVVTILDGYSCTVTNSNIQLANSLHPCGWNLLQFLILGSRFGLFCYRRPQHILFADNMFVQKLFIFKRYLVGIYEGFPHFLISSIWLPVVIISHIFDKGSVSSEMQEGR